MSKFLTTEELEASIDEWLEEKAKYYEIKESQFKRIHEKFIVNQDVPYSFWNFKNFVTRVIEKYRSPAYRDKFYTKDREHYGSVPEDLLYFLYDYAKRYGRKANHLEMQTYASDFTVGMYYCNGFLFDYLNGQGGCVDIIQLNHTRPLADFYSILGRIYDKGFKPIAVTQLFGFDTVVFETQQEVDDLEKSEQGFVCSTQFYSRETFTEKIEEYEQDSDCVVYVYWIQDFN